MSRTLDDRVADPDAPRSQRGDQAYESTLRFLQRATHDNNHISAAAPSSGPEWVRDVMTVGVVAAHEGAVFKELVASLARNRIGAVPVIDANRRVVGVVSESDLLAHLAHVVPRAPRGHLYRTRREHANKLRGATAAQLMTAPAVVVLPDTPIDNAAWLAARTRVKHLPVIDSSGVLVGIVSRGDLLRPFLRADDEIRADIIENVLHGGYIMDREQLSVVVEEGVVTLSGHVPPPTAAADVIESVRAVVGVVDVVSPGLTGVS